MLSRLNDEVHAQMAAAKGIPMPYPADMPRLMGGPGPPQILSDLNAHKFLEKRSYRTAFAFIADAYRIRCADEEIFKGKHVGPHTPGNDPLPAFEQFLDKAEGHGRILPSWWCENVRIECVSQAVKGNGNGRSCIYRVVGKNEMLEWSMNPLGHCNLREWAAMVYGSRIVPNEE